MHIHVGTTGAAANHMITLDAARRDRLSKAQKATEQLVQDLADSGEVNIGWLQSNKKAREAFADKYEGTLVGYLERKGLNRDAVTCAGRIGLLRQATLP